MIIPTTGLSFRSPSHRLHNGCGSGLGGENTATTVPMYSPSTSTTRTRPAGCPVLSLTVCHRPAGVGASPQAGPQPARTSTKRCSAERTKSVEKRIGYVDIPVEDAPRGAHERGALDHRRGTRARGDQVHLDVTRGMLDAEHAARKSLRLDVAARDGSGKDRGGADGERSGHRVRAVAGVRREVAPCDGPALRRARGQQRFGHYQA